MRKTAKIKSKKKDKKTGEKSRKKRKRGSPKEYLFTTRDGSKN